MLKYVIISAAGMGTRLGGAIPKQFIEVNGEPIFITTLKKFKINCVDKIILTIPDNREWDGYVDYKLKLFNIRDVDIIYGGSTAEETRWLALKHIKFSYEIGDDDIVVFHDAVRPNVPIEMIYKVIESCDMNGTAIPYIICKDSMCKIVDNRIVGYVDNSDKVRLQTPQAFLFNKIYESYDKLGPDKWLGSPILTYSQFYEDINLIDGDEINFKITTTDDIELYRKIFVFN